MNRRELIGRLGAIAISFYGGPRKFHLFTFARGESATGAANAPILIVDHTSTNADLASLSPDLLWSTVVAQLNTTCQGRRMTSAISRSLEELRDLTLNHPRVGIAWMHVCGQQWAEQIMSCLSSTSEILPTELAGCRFGDSVSEFASVLRKYGSRELSQDVEVLAPALLALSDRSYAQVLIAWRHDDSRLA